MKIIEQIIPAGHPNRPGVKRAETLAVVVHYTANEKPGATDTANAAYFGRKWERGPVLSGGKIITDVIEAGSVKDRTVNGTVQKVGTAFAYGSTQAIFDHDSGTIVMPLDEVAWGCGDRNCPYTDEWKGQQKIAKRIFGNRQNYLTLNVEICNNDIYPESNKDWIMAVDNALVFCLIHSA
jgi:N-acetylmuramoyl-L-alanine amidase CwlA